MVSGVVRRSHCPGLEQMCCLRRNSVVLSLVAYLFATTAIDSLHDHSAGDPCCAGLRLVLFSTIVRHAIWTRLAGRTPMTPTRRTQRRNPRTTASLRVRTIMSETALPAGSWPPRRSPRSLWWWSSGPRSCTRSSSSNLFSPRRFGRNCLSLADRPAVDRVSLIFPQT